jgi:hypothetical protein
MHSEQAADRRNCKSALHSAFVALHRSIDGSEPVRPDSEGRVVHEELRIASQGIVAVGTLACPSCDAPIALGDSRVSPSEPLGCPFCDHGAPARDFLSLAQPTRPTRVVVRITSPERDARTARVVAR